MVMEEGSKCGGVLRWCKYNKGKKINGRLCQLSSALMVEIDETEKLRDC